MTSADGRRVVLPLPSPQVFGWILALAALIESIVRMTQSDASLQFGLVIGLLALCTTLPVVLLPPAAAAIVISVASVLSLTPFHTLTVAGACALVVALYRLGRTGSQVLAAGLALPYLVIAIADPPQQSTRVLVVLFAALVPLAVWAGAAERSRADARAFSAARQMIDGTILEHSVLGERTRIARELHDVVAHHISMIAVQAESARLTTPGMPEAGAQRLTAIGDTARAALTEMRLLLGVLREDTQTEVAQRQPQPGLRQLNDLLDEARDASGTGARLILRGAPHVLDPGVELAAYRIVQEALTNARRHAPGSAVDVELVHADDTVRVRIRDNGPGPSPATAGGHGLLGMRERAAAVGGRLSTGAVAGGGFMVEAVLPAKPEVAG